MSTWQMRALCPGCGRNTDSETAKFFACCPDCGHRGEWDFGPKWPRKVMRWVCTLSDNFCWYKPWTWGCDGHWETPP